jgi:hypothetical protein
LREATRVCLAPKAKRRLFRKVRKIFLRSLHTRFSENRNPQGGEAEAEPRRADGRGISTERVTEGEQGKYGRIGALWKHLPEWRLYKDADATTRKWNHDLSFGMLPAAKASSGWTALSEVSHRLSHPPMRRACAGATESKAGCTASDRGRQRQEKTYCSTLAGTCAPASSALVSARSRDPR